MPTIFKASCEKCGAQSDFWSDFCLAVETEPGVEEPLPHPGEGAHLEGMGLSWQQVTRDGTLKGRVPLVCEGCSEVVQHDAEDPRLRRKWTWSDRIGLSLVLMGAGAGLALAWVSVVAWWERALVGFGSGIIGAILGFEVFSRFEQVRERLRPPTIAGLRSQIPCPACDSGHLHRLGAVEGLALPCPACGESSYVFRAEAIS